MDKPITLIHIGKCGGSTVSCLLKNNNINFNGFHMKAPVFDNNNKYVIIIRNPIKRFISAFNWRYKLVVIDKSQKNRFVDENKTLKYYNSVNKLAKEINDFDKNKTYIHHINEDINFYLYDFLKKCKKDNIIGVITTENINDDIKKVFGIDNNLHERKNNTNLCSKLSNLEYENLKKYLHKDYECINKLYELGCLSKKQYDILSK
jgi:hypothetical protein